MVSLVVSTLGRVEEVERLLLSLDRQTFPEFEVLLVDQNDDGRLKLVLERHSSLSIRHLTSRRGLSRGRNVGMHQAQGDILCFPDDDCWYPPKLLADVARWFEANPQFVGLFACLRDADGEPVGPKRPTVACNCTKENIWSVGVSASGFLRKRMADSIGLFNEHLGVGADSEYQSGEETDYYLRPLEQGFQMRYEPAFTVHHPSFHSLERLRRTTYPYALGGGYVQRLHGYSLAYFANQVIRSLGGAIVSLLKADVENSRIYLLRAAGQIRGYFWGPRDMARLRAKSD